MTDVQALAKQLVTDLTASQRAELIERLLLPARNEGDALSLSDAGITCAAALAAVSRSLSTPTVKAAELDAMGEALFYGLDTFVSAPDRAADASEGDRGHGPRSQWEHARFDALNLRDHVQYAVRKSHMWSDTAPSYID
ncbi:hypothetical protein [Streptomyces chryseus]